MILVDFSNIVHRSLYTQVNDTKPNKINGKYITDEFISYWKVLVLEDLFNLYTEYNKYLDKTGIVLCLDYYSKEYWRKELYPAYKAQRVTAREESEVDYREFFAEVNAFTDYLKENSPWKVLETERAEADDIILVMAREFQELENVLIYSPDKDFIQSQRHSPLIKQYSPSTKKWITPDTKEGTMEDWICEHVCLGDVSDNVPKIVDGTEFSDEFKQYLKDTNAEIEVHDFMDLSEMQQMAIIDGFPEENIFKEFRFGPVALQKKIKEHGNLLNYISSSPMLERNFRRNYDLVMEEGIPTDIRNAIIRDFTNASTEYDNKAFEEYLKENGAGSAITMFPKELRGELDASFFEW